MANDKLQRAKDQKNDEFYTQFFDIEAEINNYLDGLYDLNTAIEEIKKNTRHYAKRQITWFKNQMNAHMVDIMDNPLEKCIELIDDFYNK